MVNEEATTASPAIATGTTIIMSTKPTSTQPTTTTEAKSFLLQQQQQHLLEARTAPETTIKFRARTSIAINLSTSTTPMTEANEKMAAVSPVSIAKLRAMKLQIETSKLVTLNEETPTRPATQTTLAIAR